MLGVLRRWSAVLDRAPTVSTPAVLSRTTAFLFVAADIFSGSAALSAWETVKHPAGAVMTVLATLGFGVFILWRGARWRRRTYHFLLGLATVLISVSVLMSTGGSIAVAISLMYVLVGVSASFFFSLRLALGHMAFALVASAVALSIAGGVGLAEYFLVAGEIVITGGIVGWLTRIAAESELDPLTGLLNRRGLDRALAEQLSRSDQGAGLVLAMIDIDYFKAVNDAAGHAEGDRLLRDAAHAWRDVLGPRHLLARAGGDEFIVLLRDIDTAEADAVATALRGALLDRTATMGLAQWEPGDSAVMLLARADAALYAGKRGGRNQACWHDSATNELSGPLHDALATGGLFVAYQPIVDLPTGRFLGAEALLRWPRGEGQWVSPADFIPVAEATGLIHEIGAWTLRQACTDALTWLQAGLLLEKLSVNVSPIQLQDRDFPDIVRSVLADTGFDPRLLMLEVTESAVGAEGARAYESLSQLRALGIRVAIDDFGTGYSTLSRLRDVPIDVLKIDRSFVATLGAEESHAPIVGAVVALAGALGLATVAEGIEDADQRGLLLGLGCSEGQGFMYSPAVPSADLVGMWERSFDDQLASAGA